jgi:hypothetical protein
MWSSIGRPRTACGTCHILKVILRTLLPMSYCSTLWPANHRLPKIRCTGERPTCKRCSRLKQACSYNGTGTPSRKHHVFVPVSINRPISSSPKQRKRKSTADDTTRSDERRPVPTSSTIPNYSIVDHYDLGIPKSLMSLLVEIFFEDGYNATLLLHRRLFLESLEEGRSSPHVVLSVCAWAAK